MRMTNPRNMPIYVYKSNGVLLKKFISCSETSREFGFAKDVLSHLLKRKMFVIWNDVLFVNNPIITNFENMWNNAWIYKPRYQISLYNK